MRKVKYAEKKAKIIQANNRMIILFEMKVKIRM